MIEKVTDVLLVPLFGFYVAVFFFFLIIQITGRYVTIEIMAVILINHHTKAK